MLLAPPSISRAPGRGARSRLLGAGIVFAFLLTGGQVSFAADTADAKLCDAESVSHQGRMKLAEAKAFLDSYVPAAEDVSRIPTFQAGAAENELKRVSATIEETLCLRANPATTAEGMAIYHEALALKSALTVAWSHLLARDATRAAAQALANARSASNLDDAKTAAAAVELQAAKVRGQLRIVSDPFMLAAAAEADGYEASAKAEVDLRDGAAKAMCGADDHGRRKRMCGTYGIFAAALSYIWTQTDGSWNSRPRLNSVGVPSVAFRWLPPKIGWLAVDLGGYSAFLTKSLTATTPSVDKISCTRSPSDYENRLPCEANTLAYPYLAGYVGLTAGRDGIGFITLSPVTFGIAQLGTSSVLAPYVGVMVGFLQINGTF